MTIWKLDLRNLAGEIQFEYEMQRTNDYRDNGWKTLDQSEARTIPPIRGQNKVMDSLEHDHIKT
jgi:hypothetical protein